MRQLTASQIYRAGASSKWIHPETRTISVTVNSKDRCLDYRFRMSASGGMTQVLFQLRLEDLALSLDALRTQDSTAYLELLRLHLVKSPAAVASAAVVAETRAVTAEARAAAAETRAVTAEARAAAAKQSTSLPSPLSPASTPSSNSELAK